MATPESKATQVVKLRASELGMKIMRNNSGCLRNEAGIPIRFGLGNISKKMNDKRKSSDEIGATRITITQEMVGKQIDVFTAIEIKPEGWKFSNKGREVAQANFHNLFTNGFVGFARNAEDVDAIYQRLMQWLKST